MNSTELRLYRAVDEVLHYQWDPCGVAGHPEARDEYHAYLPEVFQMVLSEQGQTAIAAHLGAIAVDRMGLDPRPDVDLEIADLLLRWRGIVIESKV